MWKEHEKKSCDECGKETYHMWTDDDGWVCMECGRIREWRKEVDRKDEE